MSLIRIDELTTVTTVNDANVLPIVDSNNETKKVTITQLKAKLTEDITNLHFQIVQILPVSDIQTNVIYLVPSQDSATGNIYDEYIYINNNWEMVGSASVDLSDYYTKQEVNALIPDISGKLDTSKVKNEASTTAGDVYDVRYINNMIGNIETLLEEI